jgi:methylase of polypeptide subunit release factors
VIRFEPEIALFTGVDPVQPYAALAALGRSVLKRGARLAVEIHADNAEHVLDVFDREGYEQIHVHSDLAGRDRVITAVLRD